MSSRDTPLSTDAQNQRPFFTHVQALYVCSCPQQHVSRSEKLCIRIVPSKTWVENASLVRRLLIVEKDDILTFVQQDGTLINPGYDELKDREGGRKVRIMALVERTKAVELIDRLAKDNAIRGFLVHEDAPIRGWVYGEEDHDEYDRCDCDVCIFLSEQRYFENVLHDNRMRRIVDR
jgi:hypothetical protein